MKFNKNTIFKAVSTLNAGNFGYENVNLATNFSANLVANLTINSRQHAKKFSVN